MADRITVYPEGGQPVILTQNDHLATGGEGSVYAKGGVVYKTYLEPEKALRAGMERKLAALAALKHPGIAAPQGALRNKKGEFIGIVLPQIRGEALCRAFSSAWRDPHQFGLAETAAVTDAMRAITDFAHQRQALMVDANEMNWLLDGTSPVAIDVDSWQLPGFPATAIMPSIRDHSRQGFCVDTDWFAWAVVTFQVWTGLHPYKGNHPDFPRGALEARMTAMASVFSPKVRLPGPTRPIADIPAPLRSWYERTFESTERTAPPSAKASVLAPQTAARLKVRQTLAGALKTERLGSAEGRVLAAFNGFVISKADTGLRLWDAAARAGVPSANPDSLAAVLRQEAAVLRTTTGRVVVTLDPTSGALAAIDLDSGQSAFLASRAQRLWQSGNRLFALAPGLPNGLLELDCSCPGTKLLLTVSRQWPASTLSTSFFRGAFVQDCLGTAFVGVLEGDGVLQAAAPQLRGYRISEGFAAGRHNVWLSGIRLADGERVRLQLALRVGRFEVVDEAVVDELALDAAVNAAGVCVLRDGADLVVAKEQHQKRLGASGLPDSMRLFSLGAAGIGAFEDTEVVKLSLG